MTMYLSQGNYGNTIDPNRYYFQLTRKYIFSSIYWVHVKELVCAID